MAIKRKVITPPPTDTPAVAPVGAVPRPAAKAVSPQPGGRTRSMDGMVRAKPGAVQAAPAKKLQLQPRSHPIPKPDILPSRPAMKAVPTTHSTHTAPTALSAPATPVLTPRLVAKPYRPPAGPLYTKYQPKPAQPAAPVRSQPGRMQDMVMSARPSLAPATTPRRVADQTAAKATTTTAAQQAKQRRAKSTRPRRHWVSVLGLAMAAIVIGIGLFSSPAGQVGLGIYAIVALWRRWPSQQTFGLALLMFAGIIVTSLVPALQDVANNLAVYAFLLLCIGTLQLALEVRRDA